MADLLPDLRVRLAVTGLSGAGKTAFIVSALRNLIAAAVQPAALPLLSAAAERRLLAARLEPPAGDARAPFRLEEAARLLAGEPPGWPAGTRALGESRLVLLHAPRSAVLRRLARQARLRREMVDYPGEWLLDLPLLRQGFAEWSAATLALAREEPRRRHAGRFLAFVEGARGEPAGVAAEAARLWAACLLACRDAAGLSLLQPGRALMPGEAAGDPALLLAPLPAEADPGLHALMAARYEDYRRRIVGGFYRAHFRGFDRQIVLVDVLSALDRGREAFHDAQRALSAILESFRFGSRGWLAPLLAPLPAPLLDLLGGARIDRVLFAATKADHVTPAQFTNLRQLLAGMMAAPALEMRFAGGTVGVKALAAVRCTELGEGRYDGRRVGLLRGTLVGEAAPRLLFPGEVPATVEAAEEHWRSGPEPLPRFRPPRLSREAGPVPHIGLDDALEFLVGDRFR